MTTCPRSLYRRTEDQRTVGSRVSLARALHAPVELLVIADCQLQVTRDDTRLLVVTGSVTGELEDLGGEVLEDGCEVDCECARRSVRVAIRPAGDEWTDPEHRHRHAGRSYRGGGDGGYDRRGTGDRPWPNATGPWTSRRRPCHQTCLPKTWLRLKGVGGVGVGEVSECCE